MTRELSHSEVVTLAVFNLGGADRAVDTEDVAVEANKLAPGRFTWRKHNDQINLELVRVYLSDAKKPEKGGLLVGAGRSGWRLTRAGLTWAEGATATSDPSRLKRGREQSRAGSIDELRWRRERARIVATEAFQLWKAGTREIPRREAEHVFRIDSYATGPIREAKLTRLQALFAEDAEIRPFLDFVSTLTEQEPSP